jgi:hypothetical protein
MPNTAESFPHCYLQLTNSNNITFTQSGYQYFATKFAKVGIDIEAVTTLRQFLAAYELALHYEVITSFQEKANARPTVPARQIVPRRRRRARLHSTAENFMRL